MPVETYRQLLIEKYPDREEEINAMDYPGLDMIKCNVAYLDKISHYCLYIILDCCSYYQEKLDECEQMYRDDIV